MDPISVANFATDPISVAKICDGSNFRRKFATDSISVANFATKIQFSVQNFATEIEFLSQNFATDSIFVANFTTDFATHSKTAPQVNFRSKFRCKICDGNWNPSQFQWIRRRTLKKYRKFISIANLR